MAVNPKNVQQAVRLAVSLANPTLRDQDWNRIKDRFQLDENLLQGVKTLIEQCTKTPELVTILTYLTQS